MSTGVIIVALEILATLSVSAIVAAFVYIRFLRTENDLDRTNKPTFTDENLEGIAAEARKVRRSAENIESRTDRLQTLASLKTKRDDSEEEK